MAYGNNLFAVDRGATPPGWEADPLEEGIYFFTLNTCERVSVGQFERGPAAFMLEYHWAIDPPPVCEEFQSGYEDVATLLSIWVDDPELATFLRETFYMPVVLATIVVETAVQGDAEVQTWTWRAENGEDSRMVAGHPGGAETTAAPVDRFVWHNGTGVSFLDLADDGPLPNVPIPTAQGILSPPMRVADQATVPYAGLATVWKTADFYGPIYRFGDLACAEPLS